MKFTKKVTVSERVLEASFVISHMSAKNMEADIIGESVLKLVCEEMVRIVLGHEAAFEVGKIPLSDNTVAGSISELSHDIEELTLQKIGSYRFARQADDEASNYSGKCHLLTFVQFVDGYNIINQFLFMKEMKTSKTGEGIFHIVDTFFTRHGMLWDHCVGTCTDNASSMTGRLKGFVTRVKGKNPLIISTHCFFHREVLVAKTMNEDLLATLNDAVHVVNYIKGRQLISRIFAAICKSMDRIQVSLVSYRGTMVIQRKGATATLRNEGKNYVISYGQRQREISRSLYR